MILVDPAGLEIESDVTNAELSGETLEFITKVHDDTFDWRLTLKDKRHGLLHGSTGEMVIDDQVSKQRSYVQDPAVSRLQSILKVELP